MEFRVKIEMGNDAMLSTIDVSRALARLADRMNADPESQSGVILDLNGLTVGTWEVTE